MWCSELCARRVRAGDQELHRIESPKVRNGLNALSWRNPESDSVRTT